MPPIETVIEGGAAAKSMTSTERTPLTTTFVLKVAERCNLNCSYCYMYNKGDTSYLERPKFLSIETATVALERIAAYARRHSLPQITVVLYGGEPLLIGREWVQQFLEERDRVETPPEVTLNVAVQTNGTLLDAEWVALFNQHKVTIGVSCDGPEQVNDLLRVDFDGRSSYAKVRSALELLCKTSGTRWGVLTVVNPETQGSEVLKHFVQLGVRSVDFIWPDFNHDVRPPWPESMLANYFCELFDYWYELPSPPRIRYFESAMSLLVGGRSECDALGLHPFADIMVESDGAWEPLDTLRICGNGITRTGLNVRRNDVEAVWDVPLFRMGLRSKELLAPKCQECAYRRICGGGYLPHRYGRDTGIANPSVYCAELLILLPHIRERIAADLERAGLLAASV